MEETLGTIQDHRRHTPPSLSLRLDRRAKDRAARWSMTALTVGATLLVPIMVAALILRARPILADRSIWELLLGTTWRPLQGLFGFYPFIMGTLWVTGVAMVIAVPPALLTAIFLAEYATVRTRKVVMPLIDLLAGIPSVVYGVWGMLAVVPVVEKTVAPALNRWLGFIPLFRAENVTGFGILAGALVLAVMVVPIIIAVAYEVIDAVPRGLREASLALGATRWQTVKRVVLRRSLPGVVAAVMLGFSRAFGETMAVMMVVGNIAQVPGSLFDAAYPLTALIANNYGEMMSVPLYDAALLGAALILLGVVLGFNVVSRLALVRLVARR